jgi:hypothetical protein
MFFTLRAVVVRGLTVFTPFLRLRLRHFFAHRCLLILVTEKDKQQKKGKKYFLHIFFPPRHFFASKIL